MQAQVNHQLQRRINQMLGAAGLGQLDSPGLVGQIAYMVRDHEHFGSLLMACEPEERQHMWDALAPNLRFKPYALDHYLLKARADAEARRLPVQQPD